MGRPEKPPRPRPAAARPAATRPAAARPAATRSAAAVPGERLQKVLAQAGLASRREAEAWIAAGRVTVNGEVASLGSRVQGRDELRVDGRVVRRSRDAAKLGAAASVFLCHRSSGESLREGLIARLPRRAGRRFLAVSPMPQVDGGLELLTTDGALAARLQRRVRRWPVELLVRVRGELDDTTLQRVRDGQLDDGRRLEIVEVEGSALPAEGSNRWYRVVATGASGKELRQLFERQGALVSRVQRTTLGPLVLTRDLNRGHFRLLTAEEARALEAAPARSEPAAAGIEAAPKAPVAE